MTRLFSREAWTRPYAWPFLALFGFNVLVFLAFTLPRSIQERRAAVRALDLREKIVAKRSEVDAVRSRADIVKSNVGDAERFYKEQVKDCSGVTATLLQSLLGIGKDLGVRADRLSASGAKGIDGASLAEIDVSMPLTGSYQQSATFLQRLERSEHFLVVESIQMREAASRGGEAPGGTDLSMRLKAYCRSTGPRRPR